MGAKQTLTLSVAVEEALLTARGERQRKEKEEEQNDIKIVVVNVHWS